jgi:signal transduction histidine kinase
MAGGLVQVAIESTDYRTLGLVIARARIILCLSILFSIYVDPATGGFFGIERYMLATLALDLVYGSVVYLLIWRRPVTRMVLETTAVVDILIAAVLALFTEGPTSPALAIFLFAIITTGCWAEYRLRVVATLLSVALYLLAIACSGVAITNMLLMRAVYLGIAGYLIDFFGRERDRYEARVHELENASQRQTIARSLHDGFMQALAGISLRLETCRDMLMSNQAGEALTEIREIQTGVALEYDEVRNYVHALAKDDRHSLPTAAIESHTEFKVETAFSARGPLVEHIIQILLEGIRNTQQHARARFAEITVREAGQVIRIAIDDDGVGFADFSAPPWTIASRVAEFGGRLAVRPGRSAGAHLEIELPTA